MFEDSDLISAYSRREALEDGALVDISSLAREYGFRYPVTVTQTVWGILEPTPELEDIGQEGGLGDEPRGPE